MAVYDSESRDRVREAVNFIELVSARTELRRAGPGRYEGLCPFHEERTPSFGIDPERKLYHCFGCGASGDVFTYVQETEGVDFKGALELLADRYGVELTAVSEDPRAAARRQARERLLELMERTAAYYERYLWDSKEAAKAREYLAGRGLEEAMLREFRVGYAPSAWDRVLLASRRGGFTERELLQAGLAQRSRDRGTPYDRFRARIAFPLMDLRGRVLGFGARAMREGQGPKYLNTADNDLYHKGHHLYGANLARGHAASAGEVIVCEGYTDVIALHQAGMRNTVGLMGTAMTAVQVGELARLAPKVLLALDADSAGQDAMLRAARLAERRELELYVVRLGSRPGERPEASAGEASAMDPADIVQHLGAEAMRGAVAEALPFMRFRVERVLELGDHTSAAGQDRMVEELRKVLAEMPPSALRMELTRLISGRLALSEGVIERLLTAPASPVAAAKRTPSGTNAGAPGTGPQGGRAGLSRREQVERAFLAFCIAYPGDGAAALAEIEPGEHFTSEVLQRAAMHLRDGDLGEPLSGVGEQDGELRGVIGELAAQASALAVTGSDLGDHVGARAEAGAAQVEVQRLQLELARLERLIQAARARSTVRAQASSAAADAPDQAAEDRQSDDAERGGREDESAVSTLAARRAEVKLAFDRAQERALDAVGSGRP
jgi:DNA primase